MTLTEGDKLVIQGILKSYTGIPKVAAAHMAGKTVTWLHSPAAYREYTGEQLAEYQRVWGAVLDELEEGADNEQQ